MFTDTQSDPLSFLLTKFGDDPEVFRQLLGSMKDMLAANKSLAGSVGYNIKERGENEQKRYNSLLKQKGPDADTMVTLEANHTNWLEHPFIFWCQTGSFTEMLPYAQIVGRMLCLLLCEFESEQHSLLYHKKKTISYLSYSFVRGYEEMEGIVSQMLQKGSRYKNLEIAMKVRKGCNTVDGTVLVLGKQNADSTWERVLPKKGKKFNDIVDHLMESDLPEKYRTLRLRLMEHQLGDLRKLPSHVELVYPDACYE